MSQNTPSQYAEIYLYYHQIEVTSTELATLTELSEDDGGLRSSGLSIVQSRMWSLPNYN